MKSAFGAIQFDWVPSREGLRAFLKKEPSFSRMVRVRPAQGLLLMSSGPYSNIINQRA